MRFLTLGAGQMRQVSATREHATMVNSALTFCRHCMEQTPDNQFRLNVAKETEAILGYIHDPHTAYWEMRHRADAEREAFERLMRESRPWRHTFASPKSAAVVEAREMVVEAELAHVRDKLPPQLLLPERRPHHDLYAPESRSAHA